MLDRRATGPAAHMVTGNASFCSPIATVDSRIGRVNDRIRVGPTKLAGGTPYVLVFSTSCANGIGQLNLTRAIDVSSFARRRATAVSGSRNTIERHDFGSFPTDCFSAISTTCPKVVFKIILINDLEYKTAYCSALRVSTVYFSER